MEQKPWHQNEKLDPAFPFRIIDGEWRGFPLHWHEVLEFIYIRRGTIMVSVGGRTYDTVQGDVIIINSGAVHGFFDASEDAQIMIVQTSLDLFEQTLDLRDHVFQKLVFDRRVFFSVREGGPLYRRIVDLFLDVRREFFNKGEGFRLAIRVRLYELALIFLREIPAPRPLPSEPVRHKSNHQILERVFSYIYNNVDNPGITLEKAAAAAALSKFYFTHFFKDQTGLTFHTYLSRVRVNRAKEFLVGSDLPVTEIAYRCGFASLKTFNRLFKTYTDVSPSTYRYGKKVLKSEDVLNIKAAAAQGNF
jgi:AraC-like DNA-binding protein